MNMTPTLEKKVRKQHFFKNFLVGDTKASVPKSEEESQTENCFGYRLRKTNPQIKNGKTD